MVGSTTLFPLLATLAAVADAATIERRAGPVTVPLTYRNTGNTNLAARTFGLQARQNKGPLTGYQSNAYYSLSMSIGTPAQTQTLILDTGSAEIMVYGQGCTNCGSSVFNYGASSSYAATGAQGNVLYSGGAVMTGPIARENVNVGGFAQSGQQYINVQSIDPDFFASSNPGVTGVIGVSFPITGSGSTGTSWAQSAATSLWAAPRFGLYLGPPSGTGTVPNAGEITFGGEDPSRYPGRPLNQHALQGNQWAINMDGFRVNGETIPFPGVRDRITLMDTAATTNAIPPAVCQALAGKVPNALYDSNQRLWFPCASTAAVEFKFGNDWFPTRVQDILFNEGTLTNPTNPSLCQSSFTCFDSSSEPYTFVMGSPFLRNVYSVYSYNPRYIALAPTAATRGPWDYGWTGSPSSSSVASSSTSSLPPSSSSIIPSSSSVVPSSSSIIPSSSSSSAVPSSSSSIIPSSSSSSAIPSSSSTSVIPSSSSTSVTPSSSSTSVPPSSSSTIPSSSSTIPSSSSSSTVPSSSSSSTVPLSSSTSSSTSVPPSSSSTMTSSSSASPSSSSMIPSSGTTSSGTSSGPSSTSSAPPSSTSSSTSSTTTTTGGPSHLPRRNMWTGAVAPTKTSCAIALPTNPCPCRPGNKHWWYDGARWRYAERRNHRSHGWRWGPNGFAVYEGGTDVVEFTEQQMHEQKAKEAGVKRGLQLV